jgi:hypothetical protein
MDRMTKKFHEAAQLRRRATETERADQLRRSFAEGRRAGRDEGRADLEGAVPPDFARYIVEDAGREFARMIAGRVSEKHPLFGSLALRFAETVWREVTGGLYAGADPFPRITAYAQTALAHGEIELRVSAPPLEFSRRVDRFDLKMLRR